MRPLIAFTVAAAMWVLPAAAATRLEQARADVAAARARLDALETTQRSAQGELDTVALRITALKPRGRGGQLLPGGALEASLRRSQELSTQLHALASERAAAERELASRTAALWSALDEEVKRTRNDAVGATDRAARQAALVRFRALRHEREALRAKLPASQVPPSVVGTASDDPEELLEQADALRDAEDKVKRRLAAVRTRIAEVRRERELDRRMGDFLGDESLFDEGDRRLRLQGDGEGGFRVAPSAPPQVGGQFGSPAPTVSGDAMDSPPMSPSPTPPPAEGGVAEPEPFAAPLPTRLPATLATDGHPQVGATRSPGPAGVDELRELEREQQLLEQQAATLSSRAGEVEDRARNLE